MKLSLLSVLYRANDLARNEIGCYESSQVEASDEQQDRHSGF